jgi:D-tyrosyl-tRNA(Tyr) deacylase
MKTVIQRVSRASVTVSDQVVGAIQQGLLILVGIGHGDTATEAQWLAQKIAVMRIFEDEAGKFNRSLLDINGAALVVSQFTLYADPSQRRPSFVKAAPPTVAAALIDQFVAYLQAAGVKQVETGQFGASMQVELVNSGPVTILLDRDAQHGP